MFWALICPSSGIYDYIVELPHWLFRSWFAVCWSLGADRQGWYPHPNSNTQQTKNETANVVVQHYSPILLKMGMLMPETC